MTHWVIESITLGGMVRAIAHKITFSTPLIHLLSVPHHTRFLNARAAKRNGRKIDLILTKEEEAGGVTDRASSATEGAYERRNQGA